MDGEHNLFLIRVERRCRPGPGPLRFLPGSEVVLTVCSGQEAGEAYITEERKAGPCRVWVCALGSIGEHRFVELKHPEPLV